MPERGMITVCGWCRTVLPNDDAFEVQHHFLTEHSQRGGHSLRYFYPDDIDVEFHRWETRNAARLAAGWGEA